MTVINNVENKIAILHKLSCREVKSYNMKPKEQIVGIIDVDFSLMRYLGKATEINDININNCGYPTIKRKDNTTTTLSRFMIEFYSKYDNKLKQILENRDNEVNHKNRNKLDNRLENLEIVTHQENVKHSKGTSYEVLYSTEKLKLLQERCKKDKKQNIDEEYLKRISGLFYKAMNKHIVEMKILKCCYLLFRNITMNLNNKAQNSIDINNFIDLEPYKLMTNFHTNRLELLIRKKNKYIYKTIVEKDIKVVNRSIERYPYLKKIFKKFKLKDKEPNEEEIKKQILKTKFFKKHNITELSTKHLKELTFDKSYSRNILFDFFKDIYDLNWYTIIDGNILITVALKHFSNVNGKYKSFKVLYLLGLLERQSNIYRPNTVSDRIVHTPSFIKIPVYTDELLKQANQTAKKILELKMNKFTYTTVRENFGAEVAEKVFRNQRFNQRYQYNTRAKNDILNFLKIDKDIYSQGFMTKQEIFVQIQAINTQRAIKDEPHNKIYKSFNSYITSLLLYDPDIKAVLEDLGLAYVSLNSKTIQNIQRHQGSFSTASTDLKPKMKVIVLKDLLK